MNVKIPENIAVSFFFLTLLILGATIFQDYGIGWDEIVERIDGAVSLQYALHYLGINSIHAPTQLLSQTFMGPLDFIGYKDKYYPVGFNLPMVLIESLWHFPNEKSVYLFRHAITYIFFLIGAYSVFWLAKDRFSNWRLGLLAALFLIITPRIFAESFYNSKDLVLLSLFALGMVTAIQFIFHNNLKTALLHGFVTALAMEIRLMAIALLLMTVFIVCIRIYTKVAPCKKTLITIFVYFLTVTTFFILFWPLLWDKPFTHFIEAFKFMSQFKVAVDMLYWGNTISSIQLPWHYAFSWIAITTPLTYLIFWCIGFISIPVMLIKKFRFFIRDPNALKDFLFLSFTLGPLLGTCLLKTSLYDGWRHLYFIYPSFILIAIKGLIIIWDKLGTNIKSKYLFIFILVSSMSCTSLWMIQSHPLQNVYFNIFAGNNWKDNFDIDYWGLSNLAAIKEIAKTDPRPLIKIWPASYMNLNPSLDLLDKADKSRLHLWGQKEGADYIVTNYRNSRRSNSLNLNCFSPFFEIIVDQELVLTILQSNKQINSPLIFSNNSPIIFSKDGIGPCFFRGTGWAEPEKWGTWSIRELANISLPNPPNGPFILNIYANALLPNKKTGLNVQIMINNQFITNWNLTKPNNNIISIELNNKILQSSIDGRLNIKFKNLNPTSPKLLGLGLDDRLLGIGLKSISLR